ncbi:unnamed protein product [Didymodactylos carnosus]|uniref:Integrase catalytic domain-containing protein n=1 Tax=Didymodactylos carnosus TaxID=1234261 RepID=A0A814X3Y9_9BILA|nr:unnamed protein product [Didymodactylos carnosus]CAF1210985.1 unnamed protein product [Didymodactylos carnosus]CAF3778762.1 unnamed protein product [Didymodactylos carnosus]CAF3974973.1 unnamed protein product [Didymodactylos carnosus]
MKSSIDNYIASCTKCAKFNIHRANTPGKLLPIGPLQGVVEILGMDYWNPTTTTTNDNRYVLVITDYLSKFVIAKATRTNTVQTTAQILVDELIFKYGVLHRLITDNAVHFNNDLLKALAAQIGFHHIKSTPYHPHTNCQVERFNANFRPQLAKLQSENTNDWAESLPAIPSAYNTGQHASTTFTPFQLMYGCHATLPFDPRKDPLIMNRQSDYWIQIQHLLWIYQQTARSNIKSTQHYAKQRYDNGRNDPRSLPGDYVFSKNTSRKSKMEEFYSGPYIVIQVQHSNYLIEDLESKFHQTVHASHLAPVHER